MKIEKLDENKIKITITIDDLEARNIDLYSFMYNSPESQDLFWDVMVEAEKEYGFNVDDSMIYVEASTSGGGNFTLIVTKTKEKPVLKFNTSKKAKNKQGSVKLKRKKMPYVMKNGVYMFNTFDDLCNFCKVVENSFIKDTILYSLNGNYYLKAGLAPSTEILEYATVVKSPNLFEAKLKEYGKVIIEQDVIETIKKYFFKKKRTQRKNLKS